MDSPAKPAYSIVVPVYNSEHTLAELIERLERVMSPYKNYELLLIDDCSTDGSWEKLIQLKNNRAHIRLLRLTKNFGQAAVSVCGINESKSDTVITIDDDLQYPPEEIPKLIEKFDPQKHYVVFGVPQERKFVSSMIEWFINQSVLRGKKKLRFSTFRIFNKKTHSREQYSEKTLRNAQIFFTMVSPHLMDFIHVAHAPRKKGKSNYSFFKRFRIALDLLLVITEFPFYLFTLLLMLYFMAYVVAATLALATDSIAPIQHLLLPLCIAGCGFSFLGFVILFAYIRPLYLKHLGAEAYAIWQEA